VILICTSGYSSLTSAFFFLFGRHALGPSFGTMCLAGLVVAFVRLVRSLMNKANTEQGQPGALTIFLQACLESILQAVEFLTKFTTNFAAITGDSFCASAIMTWNLLKRNLLSTVLVEVISDKVLAVVMVALTLVYGIIVISFTLKLLNTSFNLTQFYA